VSLRSDSPDGMRCTGTPIIGVGRAGGDAARLPPAGVVIGVGVREPAAFGVGARVPAAGNGDAARVPADGVVNTGVDGRMTGPWRSVPRVSGDTGAGGPDGAGFGTSPVPRAVPGAPDVRADIGTALLLLRGAGRPDEPSDLTSWSCADLMPRNTSFAILSTSGDLRPNRAG